MIIRDIYHDLLFHIIFGRQYNKNILQGIPKIIYEDQGAYTFVCKMQQIYTPNAI